MPGECFAGLFWCASVWRFAYVSCSPEQPDFLTLPGGGAWWLEDRQDERSNPAADDGICLAAAATRRRMKSGIAYQRSDGGSP
jgi:hypothetical protein